MHNEQPSASLPDDEISLIELWDILVRRKAWILGCFGLCLIAAVAYLMLKPPVYQASVKLRIGQVAGAGLFESPELLSSRLLSQYGEDVADGVKRDRPFLKRATVPKALPSAIELVSEGDSPQDAIAILETVYANIHQVHDQTYRLNLKYLAERIDSLEAQRKTLERQLTDATEMMDQLKESNPVQASLIMFERGRIATAITTLDAERPALAQKLSTPQTQATELLGAITAPATPAAPKKIQVIVLASVMGLMAGVLLAFLAEFIDKARTRAVRTTGA
ncbi:MAG: Wzz/FepE/Etk N-terminal domain-containing protein [Azoarcus sp.]|nr:Wzz/FepE/Etk N-terminal domain-containing protein [Azoarcus sp.]